MYKLLLSWRYLRTRYIALASIISVTLGVATLIIVNSVMAGFSAEMHKRLHDILSDITFEGPGLDGFADAHWHMDQIMSVIGDDVAGMTPVVRVPAMLSYRYNGRYVNQQIVLIGIDDATYAQVSDFSAYLKNEHNRQQLDFQLKEDGYDEGPDGLPKSGWPWRRTRVAYERSYMPEPVAQVQPSPGSPPASPADLEPNFAPLPPPSEGFADDGRSFDNPDLPVGTGTLTADQIGMDPFSSVRPADAGHVFDEMRDQHTGIVLGIAIAHTRIRDPNNPEHPVHDIYLCRPGDDVQVTLPTAGVPPQPVAAKFTVVDFYECKMSEYDSTFAFLPLSELQQLRGMIDPATGIRSVTSIQIKLKEGADLDAVRDKLRARFPATQYPYRIQTWRDMQGPLLAAVRLETTILNILLFLIIAVAGFGILATFFMIVVEKTRDIGVLKALGAPSRGVMSIFLSYGLSLGIVGSGVGMVLGLLFVAHINDIAQLLEIFTGEPVFDPTVYYFNQIPTIVNPLTVFWVTLGAVLIAVMASVLPAFRAARLHPVEALRYE
ncbi:MAG: FtsX-like permease family protein [Pirellulaceae bacterium]